MARSMSSIAKATWKKMDGFFPMVGGGRTDTTGAFVAAISGSFKLVAFVVNINMSLKNLTTGSTIYTPPSSGAYFSVSPPLATASVNDGDKIGVSGGVIGLFAGYIGEIPIGLSLHAFAGSGSSGSTFTIYTATRTTKIYLISLVYHISYTSAFASVLRKSTGEILHRTIHEAGSSCNGYPIGSIHLMQLGSRPYAVLNGSQSLQLTVSPSWYVAGLMLYE
jgi:hypothetical protein